MMRLFLLLSCCCCYSLTTAFLSTHHTKLSFRHGISARQMESLDLVDVSEARSAIESTVESLMEPVTTATLHGISMDTVALVLGQETYGLAIVTVGEAVYSFLQQPSLDNAKVLVPAAVATILLVGVCGPMVTSGDIASVGTGLTIATGVSVGLGASYVARLLAPYSPAPKEVAALGLLVALAGFFTYTQNLVVDGFVTLPSLPTLSWPSISLPF